jgi:hypothetical protein
MDLKELIAQVAKARGKSEALRISKDQICVLVSRDRQMTLSGVLGRGRIRTTKLDEAIRSHLSNSNVLCTDFGIRGHSVPVPENNVE